MIISDIKLFLADSNGVEASSLLKLSHEIIQLERKIHGYLPCQVTDARTQITQKVQDYYMRVGKLANKYLNVDISTLASKEWETYQNKHGITPK